MKKESVARIILIVSIIILLSTGIVLTPTEHLFPIFFLVAALNIVPLAIGSKKQRILALVVILISMSLGIWSFWSLKHGKEIRQRVQELSEKDQIKAHSYCPPKELLNAVDKIHEI
jgi:hypothetical protein